MTVNLMSSVVPQKCHRLLDFVAHSFQGLSDWQLTASLVTTVSSDPCKGMSRLLPKAFHMMTDCKKTISWTLKMIEATEFRRFFSNRTLQNLLERAKKTRLMPMYA